MSEPEGLVVLGGGPGGYAAAFRAADLGLDVTLVERHSKLGGVCLHVGCIPSKTLLQAARVITEAREARERGIDFGEPTIDVRVLRSSAQGIVDRMAGGLEQLARRRRVRVVRGTGRLTGPNAIRVEGPEGTQEIGFERCILAAGSEPVMIPGLPDDPRIMTSTEALALEAVPERLLVVGGGIIGLEMACVYVALGSRVTVVELLDRLIPGADPDLVAPLRRRLEGWGVDIHLGTRLAGIAAGEVLTASLEGGDAPAEVTADRALIAVGRRANGHLVGAEAAGVTVDERGVIPVDEALRTDVPHILAIGDLVGEPMLAHKASHQGHVAAEVAAGRDVVWDAQAVPSVAYTDPEIAWAGLTQDEAIAGEVPHEVAVFPWSASARGLIEGSGDGRTKILFDPESRRVLGGGIVGAHAGDLIAEIVHAVEMGSEVDDVAMTVHAHPTLAETAGLAAEAGAGTITDLHLGPRRTAA